MIRTVLALLATLLIGVEPRPAAQPSTLIRGARVFDGTGAPAAVADVLVTGDRIAAIGPRIAAPRGARVVDAHGQTLLPGLSDLHIHARATGFGGADDVAKAYAGHLAAGVTRVADFSLSGEMAAGVRALVGSGPIPAPRLALAVRIAPPGGHGTEYGWGRAFTLEAATPREGRAAVRRALGYRPDVIKVFVDGWRYGRSPDLVDMDAATLTAIVETAHGARVPVISHTTTLDGAKKAAAAGVDALGHGVGDLAVDDALIAAMRARGTAYIPTLVAFEPLAERRLTEVERTRLRPPELRYETAIRRKPVPPRDARRWSTMRANIRRLHAAGVPIAVGADAGVGGVYHGSSAVRETMLLTELGLSPAEALAAATGVSARVLWSPDGRIAVGRRADLILVDGRPDVSIADLSNVSRVFVGGREVALASLRRRLSSDRPTALPPHRMTGPILTAASTGLRTDLGTLPVDAAEPGVPHSILRITRERERLIADARMGPGAFGPPYAYLIVPLTRGAIVPADARGFAGVAFRATGQGAYGLVLDSHGLPAERFFAAEFQAGPNPRDIRLPFAAFVSDDPKRTLDLAGLRALRFRLEGAPGTRVRLELADLRFYRAGGAR